ncbi:thioesterase superfamily protein [Nemania diffusa]|nr:thioesterase superfamily protein [Nemania diffusa]
MDNLDHAHFAAIPWCARHLQGDRAVIVTSPSRTLKPTGEDSLMSQTLNSENTISRFLQVYEEPLLPTERVNEVKAFLTLGSGLNGYADVCHGGLVTTILDEAIGMLNTNFIKPVPTPITILTRTWLTKVEGRKLFMQGTIEDEHGIVLVRADALYIQLKTSL